MKRLAAISPSRAKDFHQCPLLFRFRSIDQFPEPPSLAMLRGTLVHSVLEHLYDVPQLERTLDYAQSLLLHCWEKLHTENPEHLTLFDTENHLNNWLDSARPLISTYFTLENPQYLQPIDREKFLNSRLSSGVGVRGIADRIDRAPSGALRVVDYKTGKSPHPRYQQDALFQMRFYAMLLYLIEGQIPARTQLIYLKDGRTLTYDPTDVDVEMIVENVNNTWKNIKERLDSRYFEPRRSRLCDWCSFQRFCPEFGGTLPEISATGIEHMRTVQQ
ncbi:RecB family exonuclease [Actinotignum urinale]|uniref:PD-(D/E)XK nuclease family protein n=1 Tax=Actinotignum urinale TaxID=190146 RepID=A0AAW9HXD4_9ACTO|nr:PD-(D/E)XK nuclease family protein [Actinotignum urinale]MDY5154481.1 PD-(D/E)XK nuclease family protein [Actinotignum urinale]